MNHFIPVKITKKIYTDRLVQGEVFMRALHEFGSWGDVSGKDAVLKNNYRGDFYAGVSAVFKSAEDSEFFSGMDEDFKRYAKNLCYIDQSDIQYFKIFSLYCYEFEDDKQSFKRPDPRMGDFGDTAVLITDFCSFLERYGLTLHSKFPHVISMLDHVKPFNFYETRYLNPLFCKHESQAYQNELRLAFGELQKDIFARNPDFEEAYSLIWNHDPVTLQIGDISDITVTMPIEDFMDGYLPDNFKCRWPSNNNPATPSNYDTVKAWTRDQMKNYRSISVKPTFAIFGE